MKLRQLYPHYTEEQLKEAEEKFASYLSLALRIYNRTQQKTEGYTQSDELTNPGLVNNFKPASAELTSHQKVAVEQQADTT